MIGPGTADAAAEGAGTAAALGGLQFVQPVDVTNRSGLRVVSGLVMVMLLMVIVEFPNWMVRLPVVDQIGDLTVSATFV
jgi:hypothetical protein